MVAAAGAGSFLRESAPLLPLDSTFAPHELQNLSAGFSGAEQRRHTRLDAING